VKTARALGITACHACGLVCRAPAEHAEASCPRCGARLHARKPRSLSQTWALLIAATILYLPANLLPIMISSDLFGTRSDTILSGVVALWQAGAIDLAIVVFVASVVVPVIKIGVIAFLAFTVQRRWSLQCRERTRLYRMVERVGHWSMLDVFVVALLAALVDIRGLAQVEPGPGALAFGAVVILTMLAAMRFDPRLIWDAAEQAEPREPCDEPA
jgi:paraquat-inducible protein A